MHDAGVKFSFYEPEWAQRKPPASQLIPPFSSIHPLTPPPLPDAFIRDELSKGRYDPAISGICFQMLLELFNRTLRSDLGPREDAGGEPEHVC